MYLQGIICFLTSAGTETLAAITPTRIETGNISLARFEPTRRGCYVDKEFYFQNLNWDYAFRYSIKNCLYEAVINKILQNCLCIPNYALGRGRKKPNNISVCRAEKLVCAMEWMNMMGNPADPDLTKCDDIYNETKSCLQRCDFQSETTQISMGRYPAEMLFTGKFEISIFLLKDKHWRKTLICVSAWNYTWVINIFNSLVPMSWAKQVLCNYVRVK